MRTYTCPICGYDGLSESPGPDPKHWGSHEICPCCQWQFGYNNPNQISQYRASWVEAGAQWFQAEKRPFGWSLSSQLANIGLTLEDILPAAIAA